MKHASLAFSCGVEFLIYSLEMLFHVFLLSLHLWLPILLCVLLLSLGLLLLLREVLCCVFRMPTAHAQKRACSEA